MFHFICIKVNLTIGSIRNLLLMRLMVEVPLFRWIVYEEKHFITNSRVFTDEEYEEVIKLI